MTGVQTCALPISITNLGKSSSLNFAAVLKNISSPPNRMLSTTVINFSAHNNTNVLMASSKTKTIARGGTKDLSSGKHKYLGPKITFVSATKTAPSSTHSRLPVAPLSHHLHKHFRANSSKGQRFHSFQCIASCAKRCKSSCPKVCCSSKSLKTKVSLNLT